MSRIRPRYFVNVYRWSQADQCYVRVARYSAAHSLESAKRRADIEAGSLPLVESTWDLRSYARSGWADVTIERWQRDDGRTYYRAPGFPLAPITVYSAHQTVNYVPSIGERGY